MARRTKNEDVIPQIAQLFGLLFLAALISPAVRAAIYGMGAVVVGLLVIALVGLVVYRLVTGAKRESQLRASAVVQAARPDATSTDHFLVITKPALQTMPTPLVPSVPGAISIDTTPTTRPVVNLEEQLYAIDWFQFEKVVAVMFRDQGYAVTRRGGANPDGGIDIIIEKPGERAGVQCKHWQKWKVGVRHVREFFAALTDAGLQKGVLVTLCGFSREARGYAAGHAIEVVDEPKLLAMLETVGARFNPEILSLLDDRRKMCPKCGAEMVLRTATKGRGAGQQFWGCSNYSKFPRCPFTMPL